MPASKKKPTISSSESSTPEPSSPVLPNQEEFRQHLRHLAVSAVQVLIEQVMLLRIGTVCRSIVGRMHSQSPGLSEWFL
jgi:hypothetical protein